MQCICWSFLKWKHLKSCAALCRQKKAAKGLRLVGPNDKNPPKISCKKIEKLLLTNFLYEEFSITVKGNYVDPQRIAWNFLWNHNKWTYFVTDFPRLEPLCAALLALAHILFSAMLLPLRFDGLSHETCYFFSSKNVSSCAKHTRSCLKLKVVLGIHMRL